MNILEAIETGKLEEFLEILDEGFRAAARAGAMRSHALGLTVADGRLAEDTELKLIKEE